ncbi:hypothetical protein GCM10010358_75050 [Streptomyces minutiscleroticus]|uniref:HTH luxR-type domain-containing protein n=1 Tax=Streptomyces minutiscleroticus TaxID=68238 RepID=A0A918U907_9ACTN|nr:hypothetical protein [Streptomyces minutiscleroticus]GGY11709.1 hypothetical protein GCM10010358_75050 [Streptomyces minutiscleroticus]
MDIAQIVPLMGDEELAAYQFLVTTGGARLERLASSLGWSPGRTERVLSWLSRNRLARPRPEGPGDWTAVHPDMVKLRYAEPLIGVVEAWQAQLEELRTQLDTLSGTCSPDPAGGSPAPVVTIEGAAELRDALAVTARRCTEEVLAVQPLGQKTPAPARDLVCGTGEPVPPGVGVRVLLPHLSRHDADVRHRAARIIASGGEVRTTAASLPPLLVFDRTTAFLFEAGAGPEDGAGGAEGAGTGRAHLVRHGALVGFIVHMVVSAWATGTVFDRSGGGNRIPASLTQETKTAIVQLLAAGYKDEVVARRLGIGVRTCRKYIAELFDDLGAQSRFQAGWMARDRMPGAVRAGAAAKER